MADDNKITDEDILTCEKVLRYIADSQGIAFNLVDFYVTTGQTTNSLKWFRNIPKTPKHERTQREKAAMLAAELLHLGYRVEHWSGVYYLEHQTNGLFTVIKDGENLIPDQINKNQACYRFAEWLENDIQL